MLPEAGGRCLWCDDVSPLVLDSADGSGSPGLVWLSQVWSGLVWSGGCGQLGFSDQRLGADPLAGLTQDLERDGSGIDRLALWRRCGWMPGWSMRLRLFTPGHGQHLA